MLGSGWQPAGQQLHCVDVPGDGADRVENRCERRRCALVLMPWAMRSPWHLKNSINSAAWQRYANQNWFWVSISSIIRIVLPLSLAYKGYSYKASISKEKEKKTNNTTHTKTLVPFCFELVVLRPSKKGKGCVLSDGMLWLTWKRLLGHLRQSSATHCSVPVALRTSSTLYARIESTRDK